MSTDEKRANDWRSRAISAPVKPGASSGFEPIGEALFGQQQWDPREKHQRSNAAVRRPTEGQERTGRQRAQEVVATLAHLLVAECRIVRYVVVHAVPPRRFSTAASTAAEPNAANVMISGHRGTRKRPFHSS